MKAKYLIGSSIIIVFLIIGLFSLDSSTIAYSDISGARNAAGFVKVKGSWIQEDGAEYDSKRNIFTFNMRDTSEHAIKVVHMGARPNNFELAESIVVEGRIENDVLQSRHILTKCPSKYDGTTMGEPAAHSPADKSYKPQTAQTADAERTEES